MDINYKDLPSKVKEAAFELFPFYNSIKKAMAEDDAPVWFNADNRGYGLLSNTIYTDSYSTHEKLEKAGHRIAYVDNRLSDEANWIFVKKAFPAWKAFKPITQAMNLAPASWNKPLGDFGTSPLFSMLTSGLLGGGLGYLGGTLAENILPEEYIERGKLRKNTALLGALAGAAGPAYLGTIGQRNWTDPSRSSWNSWIEPNVFFGAQKKAIHNAYENVRKLSNDAEADGYIKEAFNPNSPSGVMNIEHMPVDAFNRVILNDPFMPPMIQAATIGIIEAADQSKGNSGLISPFDIARIGIGMGAGLSQAYLGGKVLGALAGLTPKAQQTLQQTGMFAGAVKAVVPGLFGQ
jgi:hypothetical protein